ncbi:nucleosome assembly protein 1;2 isoform X2 [Physcomitrium patens]|uniref:nucleosome assembly protein 1;2 isoform X2 n=1 Tax=Physcomitrium patens TaxID=3218 RepID=UPI003CCCC325
MSNSENMDKQPLSMADLGVALPPTSGALSAADRAGLVNVLKDKLQLLAGMPSGYLESLPAKVKRRVSVLQELQAEHDELEAKFFEEKAALEAKYQKLYEPLYVKRADIVNGVVEVEPAKDEAPEAAEPAEEGKEEVKGVPEFWLTAMKTHEILGMQITDRDEGALKFIKDIKCSSLDEPTVNKGFKLDFYFEENPYFKNSVLSKTYHMIDDNEPILEKAVGTEIEWNSGKNLTQKVMKKKAKKGSKNTKPVTKTENCDSFFNFFNPPQVPEDDQDIDQEMVEQLQDLLEQDYDVGSTIRDKIIPHAVSWFTGEALQGEDFEDDDEEGDDDDDDDEDDYDEDEDDEEEDEDEEDDDEEEVRGRKGGASKASDGQQQSGEQPPECKQQ